MKNIYQLLLIIILCMCNGCERDQSEYQKHPVFIGIRGGGWGAIPQPDDISSEPFKYKENYWWYSAKFTQGTPENPCEMRAVTDILNTVSWIRKQSWCDGTIYLYGESAGGHLALLAGCMGADVQGIITVGAPCDLTINTDGVTECYPYLTASVDKIPFSPLHQAHSGLPPILLMHGSGDDCVSMEHPKRLATKLKNLGVECQLNILEHGHIPPRYVIEDVFWKWIETCSISSR